MFKSIVECTDFIFNLKAVDHKRAPLVAMREILSQLGNPHEKIKTIHLAGSNGKGSTLNVLGQMLEGAGYQVGTFTSPHLERVNERMTINGEQISDEQFLCYANDIASIILEHHDGEFPSFFEVVTLIAFMHFSNEQVDVALMETGLGGRIDSTNVITPLLSIITTISLEHTAILGNTYGKIAFEKAGIIKEGVPVIIGVKNEEALQVIREQAKEQNAPCLVLGEDFNVTSISQCEEAQVFDYQKGSIAFNKLELAMAGPHQVANASLAITAALLLRDEGSFIISDETIQRALGTAKWAGRFERLPHNIVLDGAHNSEGTQSLIETLRAVYPNKSYHFVYAALSEKDHANSIALMDEVAASMLFTQIDLPNAMQAEKLAVLSKNPKKAWKTQWRDFIEAQWQHKEDEDILVITGSLYFIAEVRKMVHELLEMDK